MPLSMALYPFVGRVEISMLGEVLNAHRWRCQNFCSVICVIAIDEMPGGVYNSPA
jgi:hypothetical protein